GHFDLNLIRTPSRELGLCRHDALLGRAHGTRDARRDARDWRVRREVEQSRAHREPRLRDEPDELKSKLGCGVQVEAADDVPTWRDGDGWDLVLRRAVRREHLELGRREKFVSTHAVS